ncbi:hypothetical protein CGC20_22185 [Leishmania donovani]|uniref:Uncharacterized protein n=2 Tax=Leishmania donovani TaxID=5661 RepID=A0A504Y102_LEIDO|nr:hypothetical protein CGC20_22185 [Leishmania donovani]
MSYASSSYDPPSGPSPPPPRRNVAAGRRLAPLPPSLRTDPHHQVRSTRPARHQPPPSSSVLSSSSSTVSVAAGARSSSKQRQDGQCRLPPVSRVDHPAPHHAPSASPKRAIAAASVRRLFAETAPASRGSASGSSGGEVMLGHSRGARPLSGDPLRAPGFAETRCPTPQRREGAMDGSSKPSAAASSTAPQGRPKPRALALQRSGSGALGSGPTQRGESRVSGTAVIHGAPSRQPAHPERNGQRHTSSGTSLSIAANDAAAACSAPALPGTGSPSSSAQQHAASIDLPYALHDMDEHFFTDMQNWKTEEELPGLVWSLLEGVTLEAPYTSHLWAQAYVNPADLLPAPKAKASALPDMFVHRESQQRTNGFYACVRCGTPVCEPSHQVIPASCSLRGIAVFDALHMNGVELRVCTPTVKDVAPPQSRERRSSSPIFAAAKSHGRVGGAAELDVVAGGLRFLVHCRHCNGCLGVMRLDEAMAPAAAPATALFCANSACLEYVPYRTRARLDQPIMTDMGADPEAGSSDRGDGAASMFGRASVAEHAQSRGTLGSLFGPPHGAVAWGVEGAIDADFREKQGIISYAGDGTGLDASFDALLEDLNPCADPTPMSSSVGSDG